MTGEYRRVHLAFCSSFVRSSWSAFLAGALLSSCLAPDGPTPSGVLSRVDFQDADRTASGTEWEVDHELTRHLWGGWHPVTVEERLERKFQQACALEQAGLLEDAVDHLGRLQKKYPECSSVLEARGALYATLGYQRAAAGDFQRAVWIDPGRPESWAALGRMQYELDLHGQAISTLERAGELGLDSADFHLTVARTYRALERRGKAADHYAMTIDREPVPNVELYVEAATLATEGGRDMLETEALDQALQLVNRALEQDPESCQAWFVRGLLLEVADEPTETVSAYLRVLEIDPEHVAAWTNLALFSMQLGDPETCAEAAQNALQLETDPLRRRALERLISKR